MFGAWSCGCPGFGQFTNSRWITLDLQDPGFDGLALGLGMVVASGLAWSPDLHSVTTTLQSTVQNPWLTNPKEFDSDSNRVT